MTSIVVGLPEKWVDENDAGEELDMAWAVPQYSKNEVDAAGAVVASPPFFQRDEPEDEAEGGAIFFEYGPTSPVLGYWDQGTVDRYTHALTVINNWRSSHSFPLNTFQVGLRRKAQDVDGSCLIAQRIKRLSSIRLKLSIFKTMKLSQMQDIGGCRAVVSSVRHVDKLVELYKQSDIKHPLANMDDYIRQPKKSGYRGVHLIYRYFSDKKTTYNGLKIEMQIRSPLQHAWATAVETVGTFIRQALKSSQGEEKWLRFFILMGSAIARREGTVLIPGTPTTKKELIEDLRKHVRELDVEGHLHAYGRALQTLDEQVEHAHYYLVKLQPLQRRVTVKGFRFHELDKASAEYLETEQSMSKESGDDAVLVSVDSMVALRRAYPNYFLDTHLFLNAVKEALAK